MGFQLAVAQRGNDPNWNKWDELIWAQAGGDASLYSLIKAHIAQESQWDAKAENPSDPSIGLMQILIGPRGPYPNLSKSQIADPPTNIVLGSNFLKSLLSRYSMSDAVASYNAGSPMKNAAGQYVNSKGVTNVQQYVDAVLTYHTWYMNNLPATDAGGAPAVLEPVTPWGGSAAPAAPDQSVDTTPADSTDGGYVTTEVAVGGGIGLALIIGALVYFAATK